MSRCCQSLCSERNQKGLHFSNHKRASFTAQWPYEVGVNPGFLLRTYIRSHDCRRCRAAGAFIFGFENNGKKTQLFAIVQRQRSLLITVKQGQHSDACSVCCSRSDGWFVGSTMHSSYPLNAPSELPMYYTNCAKTRKLEK